jgi:hypothetical protein
MPLKSCKTCESNFQPLFYNYLVTNVRRFDQEKEYLGSEISSLSDHPRSSANNSRVQLRSNGEYEDEDRTDSMRRRAQSGFYRRAGSERQPGFRLEVQEPFDERNDTVFHPLLPS